RASIRLVQAPPLPIARQSIFSRREAGRVPFEPAPEALGRHVPVDALDSWEEVVLACDDETGEGRGGLLEPNAEPTPRLADGAVQIPLLAVELLGGHGCRLVRRGREVWRRDPRTPTYQKKGAPAGRRPRAAGGLRLRRGRGRGPRRTTSR